VTAAALLLAAACGCARPASLKAELCTPENVVAALAKAKILRACSP
jgi:hypothetical protein